MFTTEMIKAVEQQILLFTENDTGKNWLDCALPLYVMICSL